MDGGPVTGLGGTQNTWGDEVSATGLYRNASISVGQMHYETDGYRANNDLRHDIFNAVSTEFTSMIVTQRGFQSNARTITTSDEMLQELLQLKR